MRAGRENDPHLWEFAQDVELALGCAEGVAVKVIQDNFKDNPEFAKWWLERARSDGYSKQVNMLVQSQLEEFLKRLEQGLSATEFEKVLAIYAGQIGPRETGETTEPALH
jgi:hypothetical protein